jgi:hypothetical protein
MQWRLKNKLGVRLDVPVPLDRADGRKLHKRVEELEDVLVVLSQVMSVPRGGPWLELHPRRNRHRNNNNNKANVAAVLQLP